MALFLIVKNVRITVSLGGILTYMLKPVSVQVHFDKKKKSFYILPCKYISSVNYSSYIKLIYKQKRQRNCILTRYGDMFVFTMLTKYEFKKVRAGVRLAFILYFHQSHV